jgi:hypothetical protein
LTETGCEMIDVRSPVGLPGLRMGVAKRQRRLWPQPAMIDPAGGPTDRLFDRWPVRQPPVDVWSRRTVPLLAVQDTHPGARRTVTAAGHSALRVRALPLPPGVRRCDEQFRIRAAFLAPPLQMPRTHAAPAGRSAASLDPARTATEHRVFRVENQEPTAELGSNRPHQPLQQSRARSCGRRAAGHSVTGLSANQPAFSSTARVSSTVRWP